MSWNNYPENWEKDIKMINILDEDKLPKQLVIGNNYHTSWQSSPRFKFKLISHGDIYCKLKSYFNGNTFDCKITDLRETKNQSLYNARQRLKKHDKSKIRL